MIRYTLPLLATLCTALATPLASAQPSGPRLSPGLWEHSFSMKSAGGKAEKAIKDMQQAMANMPPEQRRQMEAMMAKQGLAVGPQGSSIKVCLTKEDVERDQAPMAREGCTQTSNRNGNVWNVTFRCPGPPPSSGEATITLQSATAYTGVMNIVSEGQGKAEKMEMATSGQWLGASCGNIKPVRP